MSVILNLALPFFGLILLGYIAAKLLNIEEKGLAWLNVLVIYFAVPALIFHTIANAPFESLTNWTFVLGTTLSTYIVFLLALVISVFMLRERVARGAIQGSAASFGNVGYMGLPLSVTAFGQEAAIPAALIFTFDCMLQFTLIPLIVAIAVRHEAGHGVSAGAVVRQILKLIFTHPFIIATLAGVAVSASGLHLPGAVDNLLRLLVNGAAPSALFALGVILALRKFAAIGAEFPIIVFLKVLIHPLLVLVILGSLPGLDPMWLHVALLMAALPTAANVFVLATQYRTYVEGASSTILVTTIMAAATIPVLLYLIDNGII